MSNAASTHPLSSGHQLGRYQLITTLGQGGMGTIYLAVAAGLGEFQKLCVVKELRRDLSNNEQFVDMFLQEAKLAARLNHANVVNTLEAAKIADRFFLSMEFLDGQPLSEVMRRDESHPRRTLQLRLQTICDVLAGLHYAHELRDYGGRPLEIVHRDVSPQNVFITYDGTVKVMDFGIAKAADAGTEQSGGLFRGKLAYASPEQLLGQPVDRRTDIFAAGVMLWEAIALRRFTPVGPIGQEVIDRRARGAEPRIAEAVPGVDPVLASICDRALQKNPQERYNTAEEFRLALAAHASTLGPRMEPASIGRFMETKFAAERMAMQRLIRSHLREDGAQSVIRRVQGPLGAPATADSEEEATTVADLSELIDVTRVSVPPPVLRKQKHWLLIGASAAAAVAVSAIALLSSEAPAPTTTPQSVGEPNVAAPAVQSPAEQHATPAAPATTGLPTTTPQPGSAGRTLTAPQLPDTGREASVKANRDALATQPPSQGKAGEARPPLAPSSASAAQQKTAGSKLGKASRTSHSLGNAAAASGTALPGTTATVPDALDDTVNDGRPISASARLRMRRRRQAERATARTGSTEDYSDTGTDIESVQGANGGPIAVDFGLAESAEEESHRAPSEDDIEMGADLHRTTRAPRRLLDTEINFK